MKEIDNFIAEYLRLTERAESPTSYLFWGALSCLSSVIRDNVWFSNDYLGQRIHLNTYILILGESSVVRKATPFDINERLIRGEKGVKNTKVIAGEATMQGVLKRLAYTETGAPVGGSAILLAKEMSGFFIQDPMTIPTLTNMYDYHREYDKHLASTDLPVIKDVCLSVFAGTNEIMIQQLLDIKAKQGGLLSRCIIISETERRHKDSGYTPGAYYPTFSDWDPCLIYLKRLATVKGPLAYSARCERRYDEWYHSLDYAKLHTSTGYEGRMHRHVQKISALLTAAQPKFFDSRVIEEEELEQAIELVTALLPIYKQMTYGAGIAATSRALILFTDLLLKSKDFQCSRRNVLHKLIGNITGKELDEISKDMDDAGLLVCKSVSGSTGYQLTEKYVEQFRAEQQRKARQNGVGA